MWDNLLPAFQHKQCILIDLHGHGSSPFAPSSAPSVALMAEQVRRTLESIGVPHYQLAGHSMGGYVGGKLLETDPALEHLVLLHSHPWADTAGKKQDRNRVIELLQTKAAFFIREAVPNLFAQPESHTAAIERYCNMALRMDPEAIGWAAAAMRDREDFTELLKAQPDSVSIVQGQLDPIIPNRALRAFAAETGCGFYEIPECGHMGQEENPEAVKALLLAILG